VVGSVVWLHILLGPYWCVCGALFEMRKKKSTLFVEMGVNTVHCRLKGSRLYTQMPR